MNARVAVRPKPAGARRPVTPAPRRRGPNPSVEIDGPLPADAPAAHALGSFSIFAPEEAPEPDPNALLDQAAAESSQPLPHRAALEARFGPSLDGLEVYSGPAAQEALGVLGAEAATRGKQVFLAEPDPGLEVVAHEVVHALQADPAAPPDDGSVVAEDAPAEQEAARLSQDVLTADSPSAAEPSAAMAPGGVALLRAEAPTAPPPGTSNTPSAAFAAATAAPRTSPPAVQPSTATSTAASIASAAGAAVPALAVDTATPTLELPAAPTPGLTAEDIAAQQQAAAEAEAALTSAENVTGLVGAYAVAPPTVMAQHAAALGPDAGRLVQSEEASYQETLPELHAELSGEVAPTEDVEIPTPPERLVTLEATTPPPAPLPELPPTVDPGEYTANDGLASQIVRQFQGEPGERAGQIGQALGDVQTTDSEIATSAGAPPTVPLEGESDPERIEQQQDEGVGQARAARDEAQRAVVDGPGPELVQPRVMDEAYPLGELAQPSLKDTVAPEGPQTYLDMGLTPDVQAAFDQEQQATMQASLQEPSADIQAAATERDTDREAEVSKAEQDVQSLTVEADAEQRSKVGDAHTQIQDERHATLEAQAQAVSDAEADVEAERTSRKGEIDDRVKDDEQQIRDRYDKADEDAKAEVKKGETKAEAKREEAEREAEDQSWWDRAVSFVKDAFEALTSVIGAIFDAVRSAVNTILDAVKTFALDLIDAVAGFIKDAIAAFGEFLKAAVDALLGDIFPELAAALKEKIDGAVQFAQQAVDVVADGLKAGVSAIVDGLKAGLNAIIGAFQAAVELGLAVVEAAITGDWSGLARKVLEAALKVAGVSPEEFYAFIGRAEETFQLILDDPGAFLGHCVDAFVGGVQKFADNFLEHLQTGIIQWLTGALGGAGITLPEHFDLLGVLDLVRQILGLTWEALRGRAVKLIGEKNVARLEFVADYLKTLITGGWKALLEKITDSLSGLKDTILEGIKGYLLEKIVMAAITRLATLFNPVGALVQLVLAAWNLFAFLRDQMARIAAVLKAVVDTIGDIARGVIEPASLKVEGVLASLLPLALDLLARFLGLSGISEKIKEIVEGIRTRVEKAIDTLIDKVLAMFRGKDGAAAAQPAAGDEAAVDSVPKDLVAASVVTLPETNVALGEEIAKATGETVIYQADGNALETTRKLLHEHPDARFDQKTGRLTLPPVNVKHLQTADSLKELGNVLGQDEDVSRLVFRKTDHSFEIDAEINPATPLITGTEVEHRHTVGIRGPDGKVIEAVSHAGSMEEALLYFRSLQIGGKNITLDNLKGNRNYAMANIQVSGVSAGGNPVVFTRPVGQTGVLTIFSSGEGKPGASESADVKVGIEEAIPGEWTPGSTVKTIRKVREADPDELDVDLFYAPPVILVSNAAELKEFIDKLAPTLEVQRKYDFQAHRHSEQVVWQLLRSTQPDIAAWVDSLDVVEIDQFTVNIHSEREMCRNCAAASNFMLARMEKELPVIWASLFEKREQKKQLVLPETIVTSAVPFPPHAPRLVGAEEPAAQRPGLLVDPQGRPIGSGAQIIGTKEAPTIDRPAALSSVQAGEASERKRPSTKPDVREEAVKQSIGEFEQGAGPGDKRKVFTVGKNPTVHEPGSSDLLAETPAGTPQVAPADTQQATPPVTQHVTPQVTPQVIQQVTPPITQQVTPPDQPVVPAPAPVQQVEKKEEPTAQVVTAPQPLVEPKQQAPTPVPEQKSEEKPAPVPVAQPTPEPVVQQTPVMQPAPVVQQVPPTPQPTPQTVTPAPKAELQPTPEPVVQQETQTPQPTPKPAPKPEPAPVVQPKAQQPAKPSQPTKTPETPKPPQPAKATQPPKPEPKAVAKAAPPPPPPKKAAAKPKGKK